MKTNQYANVDASTVVTIFDDKTDPPVAMEDIELSYRFFVKQLNLKIQDVPDFLDELNAFFTNRDQMEQIGGGGNKDYEMDLAKTP